jgi:hypothetical protein
VLDDFKELGRAYRETDEMQADRETLVQLLKEGQFNNPVRIVAFNTARGWSKDVTKEIAQEILDGTDRRGEQLCATLSNTTWTAPSVACQREKHSHRGLGGSGRPWWERSRRNVRATGARRSSFGCCQNFLRVGWR